MRDSGSARPGGDSFGHDPNFLRNVEGKNALRLTDDVYLVGGGDSAMNISHYKDSNVYLIDGGNELCLVDAGVGLGQDEIEANIRADGLDPSRIRRILLTHYHVDHAGGLARWKRSFGSRVVTGREAADPIRRADTHWNGLDWVKRLGFYPPDYVLEPCEVDEELDGGETIRVGSLRVEAVHTPGHCKGHFSYLLHGKDRRYLFAGDCVFWGGRIVLQNVVDVSIPDHASSLERLCNLDFEALLPGHFNPSLRNGKRHVERAEKDFREIGIARNMLG